MLTINEKIIYSALIGYSVRLSPYFFIGGSIDEYCLREFINSHSNEAGYGYILLRMPKIMVMSREIGISRNMLKKTLKRFKEIRIIVDDRIICHKDLFDEGYLTLPDSLGIKGQLLVFYAFLEYRSRPFNGIVDTWAVRLEELTGFRKDNIYDMLYKLHQRGLVQRLSDNRLKVTSIEES